jgi:hypothetical protein
MSSSRVRVVVVYLVVGIVTTVLLTGLKLAIEQSSYGRQNELWVFTKLQDNM